jgi:glycosyltransferase involved in cell wall biosynthesis
LRIALDATYSVGKNLSGVGVYSREILRGVAAAGGADFLWCYRPHRFLASTRERLPSNARRRILWENRAVAADLLHALNQRVPAASPGRVAATFHDLFVLTGDYSSVEFRRRFAAQAREAAARSDLVIAVSRFTAGQVEALLGVEKARIRVVPHGVRHAPVAGAPREPVILFVGALQRRKNLVRLIEAFERLPERDWRLVLAGSHGYGAGEILARIESSARRQAIIATGYLPDAELDRWYARASIFAFPSLDEGFGMPVLEAMSRGVPVLTSNRSALPEVAGDAALLVDPESADEISAALDRLIGDPALRSSLASRGLARAREFRWEDATARTWDVYRELLA